MEKPKLEHVRAKIKREAFGRLQICRCDRGSNHTEEIYGFAGFAEIHRDSV